MKKLYIFKGISLILILIFMFIGYLYLKGNSETCFKIEKLNSVKNLNTNKVKRVPSISKVLKELKKNENICILNIKKDKNSVFVKISCNSTLENLQRTLDGVYKISSFKNIKQLDIKEENNNIDTYLEVEFYPEFI